MSAITAIVLSAGLGKRMRSSEPKVLHRAAGRPLLLFPLRAALEAGASAVVCVVSPDIEERVALLKGHLTIDSAPDQGTKIHLRVPVSLAADSASIAGVG